MTFYVLSFLVVLFFELELNVGSTDVNIFCAGDNKVIRCQGTDVIGINTVIYGRLGSLLCFNDTLASGTCNGSVEARRYVESKCRSKSSCTLQFKQDFGNCSRDFGPFAAVLTSCLLAPDSDSTSTKNTTCNDPNQTDSIQDNIALFLGIAVAFVVLLAIASVISYCIGSQRHKKSTIYMGLSREHPDHSAQYTAIDESLRRDMRDESHYTIPHTDGNYTYPNSVENNALDSSSESNRNDKSTDVLNEPYYFEPIQD